MGGVVSLFISAKAGRWRNTSLYINPGIVWPSWLKCKFTGSNLLLSKSPYKTTIWQHGMMVLLSIAPFEKIQHFWKWRTPSPNNHTGNWHDDNFEEWHRTCLFGWPFDIFGWPFDILKHSDPACQGLYFSVLYYCWFAKQIHFCFCLAVESRLRTYNILYSGENYALQWNCIA